jgi:hypothetical protein
MRTLIAIVLLAVFGLPFVSSILALTPKSEADLPACCRRNGQHHCMMSAAERNRMWSQKTGLSAPLERCPYGPAAVKGIDHRVNFVPPRGQAVYAGFISHPTGLIQTECRLRISRDRAQGKRGPPTFSL